MNDIYSAPQVEPNTPTENNQYGSIEKAIAGDYELSIGAVISEAWTLTKGAKWTIHLALSLYMVVFIALIIGSGALLYTLDLMPENDTATFSSMVAQFITQIVLSLITLPLAAGLMIIGLRRAVNAPITATSIFGYFNKSVVLIFTMIIMYVLLMLGFLCLVIPGIYLAVAYYMAMILVVEKDMSPWQALETSRKAITRRWFTFFGLGFVIALINFIAAIPLGLGMIWSVPFSIIVYGIVYRNMFGCEPATIN